MSLETSDRNQKAVYWAASGTDMFGNRTVSSPIELKVRWESKTQEITNSGSEIVASDAFVVVDRDIEEGSILWLGKLSSVPSPVTNLKKVVAFSSIPDVKGKNFRRVAYLAKHGDSLPTVN